MKLTRLLIPLLCFCLFGCSSLGLAQKDKVKGKSTEATAFDEDLKKVRPTYPEPSEEAETAQEEIPEPTNDQNLEVKQRLEEIAEKNAKLTKAQGYRILLYVGQSKAEAEQALRRFKQWESAQKQNNPDTFTDRASYLVYKAPNFRLKVGDFRDRLQAYQMAQQLKELFPNALVVPESRILLENVD